MCWEGGNFPEFLGQTISESWFFFSFLWLHPFVFFNKMSSDSELMLNKQDFNCLPWASAAWTLIIFYLFWSDGKSSKGIFSSAIWWTEEGRDGKRKRFPVFQDISYATLQWHKNNELGVELIALEITLSLLWLGKLFVVMDEKEYVAFSSVLPDHCL